MMDLVKIIDIPDDKAIAMIRARDPSLPQEISDDDLLGLISVMRKYAEARP